jgi:NADH-quinone oxidoreductase subunit N
MVFIKYMLYNNTRHFFFSKFNTICWLGLAEYELNEKPLDLSYDSCFSDVETYSSDIFSFYFYQYDFVGFTLWGVLPEFFILIGALVLILFRDLSVFFKLKFTFCILFLVYFYYLVVFSAFTFPSEVNSSVLNGFLVTDFYILFFKGMAVFLTMIVLVLAQNVISMSTSLMKEFFGVLLLSLFFMLTLLSTSDFFSCFLALEGMSFCLYILSASVYYSHLSIEAALKYLILGSVASSIMLYGLSLLFLLIRTLNFFSVKWYFVNLPQDKGEISADIYFIIICLVISFLFKLSAFPCHMWVADIYEGVWTPVTAFFTIVVKMVIFVFVLRVFCYTFNSLDFWRLIFLLCGLGSIAVGCLGAIMQYRIKRFLAYTSINQVGFLLLGLSSNTVAGIASTLIFLFLYLIMVIIFFGLLLNVRHFKNHSQVIFLTDLYGVKSKVVDVDCLWVITLFSMSGIPPLGGFFTKYFILINLIEGSRYFTVLFVLVFTTISSYYYVNVVKYIILEKSVIDRSFVFNEDPSSLICTILFICFSIVIGFMFLPEYFYDFFQFLAFKGKFILQ